MCMCDGYFVAVEVILETETLYPIQWRSLCKDLLTPQDVLAILLYHSICILILKLVWSWFQISGLLCFSVYERSFPVY